MVSILLRPLAPSDVDPSEIRRITEQVLAEPRFAPARPGLVARALLWLEDALARLIAGLAAGDGGTIVGVVVLVLAVGVTAFLVARLLLRVRRDPGIAVPAGIGGRTAEDWRGLAERAEAAGDWNEALRCSYRALLAELVTAGVTDEVAGRTARDYLRDISAAAPEAEGPMTWMTHAFEATWYDRQPASASDLDAMRTASGHVRRTALVARR